MSNEEIEKKIEEARNSRCRYCSRRFDGEVVIKTIDHVIPKSKFGKGGRINKVFCCEQCNTWKKDYTLEQWEDVVGKYIKLEKERAPFTKGNLGLIYSNIGKMIKEIKNVPMGVYKTNVLA